MFACVYFHELDFSTLVVGIFNLGVTSGDDSSDDLVWKQQNYVCTDGTFNVVMLESCVSSSAEI